MPALLPLLITKDDADEIVDKLFDEFEDWRDEAYGARGPENVCQEPPPSGEVINHELRYKSVFTGLRVRVTVIPPSSVIKAGDRCYNVQLLLPSKEDARGYPVLAEAILRADHFKQKHSGLSQDSNVEAALEAYFYALARVDHGLTRSRKPTNFFTLDNGSTATEKLAKAVPFSATTHRLGEREEPECARKLSVQLANGKWHAYCRAPGCERLGDSEEKDDERTANRCSNARCVECKAESTKVKAAQPAAQARRAAGRAAPPKPRRDDDDGEDEERPPQEHDVFQSPHPREGDARADGSAWASTGASEIGLLIKSYWDDEGVWMPCKPKNGSSNNYWEGEVVLYSKADSGNRDEDLFMVHYEKDGEWHELTSRDVAYGLLLYSKEGQQLLEIKLQKEMERKAKDVRLRRDLDDAKAAEREAAQVREETALVAEAAEAAEAAATAAKKRAAENEKLASRAFYEASAKRRRLEQQQPEE